MKKEKLFNLKKIKITKKYKLSSLKIFLSKIKEKQFQINKSVHNVPWKFLKLKKFIFYFIYFRDEIIGNITILDNSINKHLYFLYIDRKFRKKGIGSLLLKKRFLRTNKFKTVHVLKSLKETIKFYKKYGFIVSKKNESKNVIKWVNKCTKYEKKTYDDKYLIVKDFKS